LVAKAEAVGERSGYVFERFDLIAETSASDSVAMNSP
jgi:hypothetical protein